MFTCWVSLANRKGAETLASTGVWSAWRKRRVGVRMDLRIRVRVADVSRRGPFFSSSAAELDPRASGVHRRAIEKKKSLAAALLAPDDARTLENGQVFDDSLERHVEMACEVARGERSGCGLSEAFDDPSPTGVCEG